MSNMSIPRAGRSLHYVIGREILRTKTPSLLIVEATDHEPRDSHPDFFYLANRGDILTAPLLLNTQYFNDLLRLPSRQITLFVRSVSGVPPLRREFSPAAYIGPHMDRTREIVTIDGRVVNMDKPSDQALLERNYKRWAAKDDGSYLLPKQFVGIEYGVPRRYMSKLRGEAAANDKTQMEFAYLPRYKGRAGLNPNVLDILAIKEPVIDLGGVAEQNPEFWRDLVHVNRQGAIVLTQQFAEDLVARHPDLGVEADQCPARGLN